MCGIAGFVGAGNRDHLAAMTAALKHRGPDGDGFFIDPDVPSLFRPSTISDYRHCRRQATNVERGRDRRRHFQW